MIHPRVSVFYDRFEIGNILPIIGCFVELPEMSELGSCVVMLTDGSVSVAVYRDIIFLIVLETADSWKTSLAFTNMSVDVMFSAHVKHSADLHYFTSVFILL